MSTTESCIPGSPESGPQDADQPMPAGPAPEPAAPGVATEVPEQLPGVPQTSNVPGGLLVRPEPPTPEPAPAEVPAPTYTASQVTDAVSVFAGWLSRRQDSLVIGRLHDPVAVGKLVRKFLGANGLPFPNPDLQRQRSFRHPEGD